MTSPVFETMFFGSVPQPQPVVIPDINSSIFQDFLQLSILYLLLKLINYKFY